MRLQDLDALVEQIGTSKRSGNLRGSIGRDAQIRAQLADTEE